MWPFRDKYPVLVKGIVHLKTDRTFRGVIWARKGGYLVLRNVELLERRQELVSIDGEVAVREADIEFIQAVG